MEADFCTNFTEVVVQIPVIFGDFINANMDPRPYTLIEDHEKVGNLFFYVDFSIFEIVS